jgi:hypothetical protein
MFTKKEAEILVTEFEGLDNDTERWKWVKKKQDENPNFPAPGLDNDDTSIYFEFTDDDGETDCLNVKFDDFVGWHAGVFSLCEALGVRVEGV